MQKVRFFTMLCVTLAMWSGIAIARDPLPQISATSLISIDVVEYNRSRVAVRGEPVFAKRTALTVRWFTGAEHGTLYEHRPSEYPDVARRTSGVAFYGADPVARFPQGRRSNVLGLIVPGDVERYSATYRGAVYAFSSQENRAAFLAAPDKYVVEVGSYCLGAMSLDRVTPGDPRHVLFVPEIDGGGAWATFGSHNGPIAWSRLSPDERRSKFELAWRYYLRKTSPE